MKKLVDYNLINGEGVKALEMNRKIVEYKYDILEHRRF
jgi:hypothetical protein